MGKRMGGVGCVGGVVCWCVLIVCVGVCVGVRVLVCGVCVSGVCGLPMFLLISPKKNECPQGRAGVRP